MKRKDYFGTLYFDVTPGTTVSADLNPAGSVDYTERIAKNIYKLLEIMGVTEMLPLPSGTLIKRYASTITEGDPQAAEGDIIPLSKYTEKELDPIELKLRKWRRLTTIDSIQRVGQNRAINKGDEALVSLIQGKVKSEFFGNITGATGVTTAPQGANLQEACSNLWGSMQIFYEDKTATPIFFVNPMAVAKHLSSATIIQQEAFGFGYLVNFLGLGTALLSEKIPQDKVFATAMENLNAAYVPQGGEVANALDLTYDETGLVGMTHSTNTERAGIETLVVMGFKPFIEDKAGILVSQITPASPAAVG